MVEQELIDAYPRNTIGSSISEDLEVEDYTPKECFRINKLRRLPFRYDANHRKIGGKLRSWERAAELLKLCDECKNEYRCIGGTHFQCPWGKPKYEGKSTKKKTQVRKVGRPRKIPKIDRLDHLQIVSIPKVDQKDVYSAIKKALQNGDSMTAVGRAYGISSTYTFRIKEKGEKEGW